MNIKMIKKRLDYGPWTMEMKKESARMNTWVSGRNHKETKGKNKKVSPGFH